MSRPKKIKKYDLLKTLYLEHRMSITEISKGSREYFGQYVSSVTIMNTLKYIGVNMRPMSEAVSMAKAKRHTSDTFNLSDIVRSPLERWNARWLIATKEISSLSRSMLKGDEAKKLRTMLDVAGDKYLVPEDLINNTNGYWMMAGFPFYSLSIDEQKKEWDILRSFVPNKQPFPWSGRGTNLASLFHPHIFDCRKKGKLSPIEFFNSESMRKSGIRKLLCLYGKVTPSNMREICRNDSASSRVNNFPPRVAKAIIDSITVSNVSVLDPCAGFSGRMLGCMSSSKCSEYTCIDLSEPTYQGLLNTKNFISSMGISGSIDVIHGNCNTVMPNMNREFDVIMTSPPFLDAEEYTSVKVDTDYNKWLQDFIYPMMYNCWVRLKQCGVMVLYIERIKNGNLISDVKLAAKKFGFYERSPLLFNMSYGENNRGKKASRIIEVLVWQK